MKARYFARVQVRFDHDVKHGSYLLLGLSHLAANGFAEVRFTGATPGKGGREMDGDGGTFVIDLEDRETGENRRIAVDLYDRSDEFCHSALATVDVYFKRSVYRPDLSLLPREQADRIVPFGLHVPCISAGLRRRILRCSARSFVSAFLRGPVRTVNRALEFSNAYHQFLGLPYLDALEQLPGEQLEKKIIFQTRIWPPEDMAPDNAEEVNGERVALVRSLRKEFGNAFVGGLVPTEYAREVAPDAVTDKPTRNRDYIRMSKRNLVAVYSRGLHHSMALKLPEYFAASQCVVASPFRNELPRALQPGREYLEFSSVDDCVAEAGRLLDDPDLAASIRRAAHDYYREEVLPVARMRACVERAFAPQGKEAPVQPTLEGRIACS